MAAFLNQTIGDYTLVEHIGSGGMGDVYRAVHLRIGRVVAVKILTCPHTADSAYERFRNEARVHSTLSHPNIATLFEFCENNGHAYIIMEYVDGQTLSDRIQHGDRLNVQDVLNIFRKVLGAVDYIHQCNIIHRDIKSTNIKVTSTQDIKLLDFGIAKAPFSSKLTHDGSFIGTIEYLAPEQIQGKPATVQSDIWALGVLLYEMLTGVPPFQSDSLPELCDRIITGGYPPLSAISNDVPPVVKSIIERCLKKKAEHRYLSVQQIIQDVDGLLKTDAGGLLPSGKIRKVEGSLSRLKDYWPVVALIVVIAVGIIVLKSLSGDDDGVVRTSAPQAGTSILQTDQDATNTTLTSHVRIDVRPGEPAEILIRGKNGEIGSGITPYVFEAPVESYIDFELRRSGYRVLKRRITVYEIESRNVYTYSMCREGDDFCSDE